MHTHIVLGKEGQMKTQTNSSEDLFQRVLTSANSLMRELR